MSLRDNDNQIISVRYDVVQASVVRKHRRVGKMEVVLLLAHRVDLVASVVQDDVNIDVRVPFKKDIEASDEHRCGCGNGGDGQVFLPLDSWLIKNAALSAVRSMSLAYGRNDIPSSVSSTVRLVRGKERDTQLCLQIDDLPADRGLRHAQRRADSLKFSVSAAETKYRICVMSKASSSVFFVLLLSCC